MGNNSSTGDIQDNSIQINSPTVIIHNYYSSENSSKGSSATSEFKQDNDSHADNDDESNHKANFADIYATGEGDDHKDGSLEKHGVTGIGKIKNQASPVHDGKEITPKTTSKLSTNTIPYRKKYIDNVLSDKSNVIEQNALSLLLVQYKTNKVGQQLYSLAIYNQKVYAVPFVYPDLPPPANIPTDNELRQGLNAGVSSDVVIRQFFGNNNAETNQPVLLSSTRLMVEDNNDDIQGLVDSIRQDDALASTAVEFRENSDNLERRNVQAANSGPWQTADQTASLSRRQENMVTSTYVERHSDSIIGTARSDETTAGGGPRQTVAEAVCYRRPPQTTVLSRSVEWNTSLTAIRGHGTKFKCASGYYDVPNRNENKKKRNETATQNRANSFPSSTRIPKNKATNREGQRRSKTNDAGTTQPETTVTVPCYQTDENHQQETSICPSKTTKDGADTGTDKGESLHENGGVSIGDTRYTRYMIVPAEREMKSTQVEEKEHKEGMLGDHAAQTSCPGTLSSGKEDSDTLDTMNVFPLQYEPGPPDRGGAAKAPDKTKSENIKSQEQDDFVEHLNEDPIDTFSNPSPTEDQAGLSVNQGLEEASSEDEHNEGVLGDHAAQASCPDTLDTMNVFPLQYEPGPPDRGGAAKAPDKTKSENIKSQEQDDFVEHRNEDPIDTFSNPSPTEDQAGLRVNQGLEEASSESHGKSVNQRRAFGDVDKDEEDRE